MEDLIAEVIRVWSSTTDLKRTLLVVLLAAFLVACIRSVRMSIDKCRRIQERLPGSTRKMLKCAISTDGTHNFPPAKRGQTVKCRNCPRIFRR